MLTQKKILLGVTGGIAAYKSAYLVSKLVKLGNQVKVIMTKSAQEFVSPLTFKILSQNIVYVDMFDKKEEYDVKHISLAKWCDLILIAPATYNIIGKIASGIADDLLSCVVSACKNKVFLAPAMNENMYLNPVLEKNIEKLKELGYIFTGPDTGFLACGDEGEGRMSEPEEIIDFLDQYFSARSPLYKKNILITASATREPIDAVRFISNYSSGKMGFALAKQSLNQGAEVTLITGPSAEAPTVGVNVIKVTTAQEMLNKVKENFDICDVFISCAAVADYRPKVIHFKKIKKKKDELNLGLVKNTDILKEISKNKKDKILIGFAAESEDLLKNARAKLKDKKLDLIVANDITLTNSGFGADYNKITIISQNGLVKDFNKMTKSECAKVILEEVGLLLTKNTKEIVCKS